MNKKEESNAINIQLYSLIFFLIASFISILLTYNQKLSLEKKKTIFTSKSSLKISLFNRKLIVILTIIFQMTVIPVSNATSSWWGEIFASGDEFINSSI